MFKRSDSLGEFSDFNFDAINIKKKKKQTLFKFIIIFF